MEPGEPVCFAESLGTHTVLLPAGSYSRENEYEAGALAWQRLVAADLDPGGFISFLKRLEDEEKNGWRAKLEQALAKTGRATSSASPYRGHHTLHHWKTD